MKKPFKRSFNDMAALSGLTRHEIILLAFALQAGLLFIAVLCLIYSLTVFGLLLSVFLILFYAQIFATKHRNYRNNFNSALRTTIQINGHIKETAEAFSRSGPLRRQCADFARRLTAGEEPFAAAVISKVPLEIETAMALSMPSGVVQPEEARRPAQEIARRSTNSLAIASQLFYLIIICGVLTLFAGFHAAFIAPTMRTLLAEMQTNYDSPSDDWALFALMLTACFIAVISIGFYLIAIIGLIPQILALPGVPLLPVAAARNSAILTGIATTIESSFSLKRFCEIGKDIYRGRTRKQFEKALLEMERGYTDPDVLYRTGWIRAVDQAWLQEATPKRKAEILRNIGRQNIRHADANLNWIMAIGYPVAILCLATAATPFAALFFTQLSTLITQLA
jgi:hypothetical protein